MIRDLHDLISFLRVYHRDWTDTPELDPELLPNDLPVGLALLYRELGDLIEMSASVEGPRAPFNAQDALMPLSRLKRVDGMFEFAWENQGNWSCRCPIGIDDPPVYSNAPDVWNTEQRGFQKVCESLNHFLITLCLQEATFSGPCLTTLKCQTFQEGITQAIEPLWLNGFYVEGKPSHNFYVVPRHEMILMDYAGLWIGALSDDGFDIIKHQCRGTPLY